MDIIILPAVVQGADAAPTIAARIREVNEFLLADVMIVGRGGGSIEDLLPFSEECVIEAIHESEIPVISAVGHEIDWAISDYVADLRAPTPSAAAELVCQSSVDQLEQVQRLRMSMTEAVISRLNSIKLRLAAFSPTSARAHLENSLNRKRLLLEGDIPSPINPPSGCRFHTRCPYATEKCKEAAPELKEYGPGHFAACHLLDEKA